MYLENEGNSIKKEKKFCPKCGSTDLFWASGLPQMWSIWDCRKCGYRGPIVLEDSELAKKLREEWEIDHALSP
jgi:ribosomal protein S27AE